MCLFWERLLSPNGRTRPLIGLITPIFTLVGTICGLESTIRKDEAFKPATAGIIG